MEINKVGEGLNRSSCSIGRERHMNDGCTKEPELRLLEEQQKNMISRMDKYETMQQALYKLSESIAVMVVNLTHISEGVEVVKSEMSLVKADIVKIKDNQHILEIKKDREDASNWRSVWKRALDVFVTAVVVYVLAKWGL